MALFSNYRDALEAIQNSKRPIFILLEGVEGDALGSTMALARALEQNGVVPEIFCRSAIPDFLQFLLARREIIHDSKSLNLSDYDLAVVMDAGTIQRTGIQDELAVYLDSGDRKSVV